MSPRDEQIFRALLQLFPADFRERYARAMLDFHRDRIAAARRANESMAFLRLRTIADLLVAAAAEHLHTLTREAAVQTILQDFAYAVRGLARRPGFTAVVVTTIALGIGANAAIFTVVNGVLLQPLPYRHAERIVSFGHEPPQWLTSEPDFVDYHRELRSFDGLAAFVRREATLSSPDHPERLQIVRATDDFFPVFGVAPLIGRTFLADEFVPQQAPVVVVSYALWQRQFGGDRGAVGRAVPINGIPRTIVGVMPPRFGYPDARVDLWMPMARFHPDSMSDRDSHDLSMVGRLAPGVRIETAFTEANGLAKRFMREFPTLYNPREPLTPKLELITDDLVGNTRPYLYALLGTVSFVLLIACANVANLLLVRGESRQKEMAVRSALGASRVRLLVQLLTESIVLASLGGVLALLFAWLGDRALVALAPGSIPRLDEIRVDRQVVAFTAVVTLVTGVIVGLVPGLRASRDKSSAALKDGTRTSSGQAGARTARRALVIVELALAVITLAGTGMLVRSLWNLVHEELGFNPHGVITAAVALPQGGYDDAHAVIFYEQLLTRIRALPSVASAGAAGWLPVVDAGGLRGALPEGRPFVPGQSPLVVPQQVTSSAIRAMGLTLYAGRDFTTADGLEARDVIIVSKRLADDFWPNESALGKRMRLGNPSAPLMTVVGVVSDIRSRGFGDTPEPTMYFPYAQSGRTFYYQPHAMSLVVRASGDPATVEAAIRDAVRALDRTVPVSKLRTMEDIVGISVADRRFTTVLLAGFAVLALLLAGIGTYGVIAYGVSQRYFEIGLRIALGAGERSVLTLVMSEGLRLCLIGLALGLVASIALGRALRALLVGVSAIDVPTLLSASLALVIVALLASLFPARRATAVSPITAMRGP